MRKKIIFTLSIFAIMLFVMLIMPNKAMAVQSITSVEVTNKIPKYNDSLPHNSATVTAKVGSADCDKVSVTSSTWYISQDTITFSQFNQLALAKKNQAVKLVTEVQISDTNYVFSNSLTATGKAVDGYSAVDVVVKDSKHATITSIYYRLDLSTHSSSQKLYFIDTTNLSLYVYNDISYHLPGSTVSLEVNSTKNIPVNDCNYYPTSPYVYDINDENNVEKRIYLTQGEDYYHYTFVMPSYSIENPLYYNNKKVNAEVILKNFDFVENGSGYYKLSSDGTDIERITNEGQYYLYNFRFELDTLTLTVRDVSERGNGVRIYTSSSYFGDVQNYLYVHSGTGGPENFTLKMKGHFYMEMPADSSLDTVPIMVKGTNLIIENDSDNYQAVLNIQNSDNINQNNIGIYCDRNISIINHNTNKQDALKIITKAGNSYRFGAGIIATNDILIQNTDLNIQLCNYTCYDNKKYDGITGLLACGNITLKDSNLYMQGALLGGIQASKVITLDGGNCTLRTLLSAYNTLTYCLWSRQDIIVKNKAVLDVTGEYFIGIPDDRRNGTIKELDLSQYNSPYRIVVDETMLGPERKEWNGTTPLSHYPCFIIEPGTPTGQDVYIDNSLQTLDITITEPQIGELPAMSGTVTANKDLTDAYDIEWYWYQNSKGTGLRSQISGTEPFHADRYYFIEVVLKPTSIEVPIDKIALRTLGNVKVNGKNVIHNYGAYPGYIEFNQNNHDGSSGKNLVITYAFGKLGEDRTITVKAYDITLDQEASGGWVRLGTDKGATGFDFEKTLNATYGSNAYIQAYAYPSDEYEFVEWRLVNPKEGTVFSKNEEVHFNADHDFTFYAIFKEKTYDISLHNYNLTTGTLDDINTRGGTIYLKTNTGSEGWTTSNSREAKADTRVDINAWPASGYEFIEWRLGSPTGPAYTLYDYDINTGTYKFTATEDLDLYAIFYGGLPFPDVNEGDWYAEAVEYAFVNSLISGYASGPKAGCFGPNDSITRAQIVTILWRQQGKPVSTYAMDFKDVKDSSAWYYEAIRWAAEHGIVTGYLSGTNAGKFKPDDNITREQLALILQRYAEYCGKDSTTQGDISGFPDKNKVSDWALEGMQWAVGKGIISGKGDGRLDPGGTATRAEAATMIMRFCKNILGL